MLSLNSFFLELLRADRFRSYMRMIHCFTFQMNRSYGLHSNLRSAYGGFGNMSGSHCFVCQLMWENALVSNFGRGYRLLH
ncbi:hypothetical protein D3C76_968820 [compost metagenome]